MTPSPLSMVSRVSFDSSTVTVCTGGIRLASVAVSLTWKMQNTPVQPVKVCAPHLDNKLDHLVTEM